MKKLIYALAITTLAFHFSQAQEEGKFRVGLDFGYAMPDGGGGLLFGIEPKYNVAENMNVGIRFESAIMAKNVTDSGVSLEADLAASSSYLGTFDYYFNNGSSSFAPFVGAGVGFSALANVSFEDFGPDAEAEVDGKFGGMIRTGFEWGKFRTAVNYNLIGKTEIDGAEIKNSYLGISLGFYVGGGKWKK